MLYAFVTKGREQNCIPGKEETFLVKRRSRNRRGNASVWNVFELFDTHFFTKLWICYQD